MLVDGGTKRCCSTASSEESLCSFGNNATSFSYKRRLSTDGTPSDILAMTAKDLNSLSSEDRERVFEEVNGIPASVEEDLELVEKSLADLDEAIRGVRLDKSAYDCALAMSPEYVCDRGFRLMFLRSEFFDVRKAARRMVKYFDSKRLLFGEEKLVKRITYDDLDDDDRVHLFNGSFQILRSRDQAGK